jgi:hypothetical protein
MTFTFACYFCWIVTNCVKHDLYITFQGFNINWSKSYFFMLAKIIKIYFLFCFLSHQATEVIWRLFQFYWWRKTNKEIQRCIQVNIMGGGGHVFYIHVPVYYLLYIMQYFLDCILYVTIINKKKENPYDIQVYYKNNFIKYLQKFSTWNEPTMNLLSSVNKIGKYQKGGPCWQKFERLN